MNELEEILNTPDNSDIGYFIKIDLKWKKKKNKDFSNCFWN